MKTQTFGEFKNLAEQGNVIPVYSYFLADLLTPVSAFLRLQSISKKAFLLESVEGGEKTARYSFLGCAPYSTIRYSDNLLAAKQEAGNSQTYKGNIFDLLSNKFLKYQAVHPPQLPRFTGGAVGYFGYETIRLLENIPPNNSDSPEAPDALFMFFDTIVAFDHLTHGIFVIANTFLEEDQLPLRAKYEHALQKISATEKALRGELSLNASHSSDISDISSNFSKDDFHRAVETAQRYIKAGDIFQVVLSQKFEKCIAVAPFDIYRALRVINPSPYLYYLHIDDLAIIGSSPELLVRVDNGMVQVRPIAGTRPRGKNEQQDLRYEEELRQDEKEIAEHVMLVDLGRNDVGRVCEYGSVGVTEFMKIEKYSHVMHLVSNVEGKLKSGLTAIDALKACFPAGTVTGAPKIRAMEIIQELEPAGRGIYAGALGYLDFSGNLDTCIAIRTIVTQNSKAYFQAGAGIVADSIPEREYQETLNKARALRTAIEFAERGLQ